MSNDAGRNREDNITAPIRIGLDVREVAPMSASAASGGRGRHA